MDEKLVSYLKELDVIESNESRLTKIRHVEMLNNIARKWAISLGFERGIVWSNYNKCQPCAVFIQGSTSLGVSFKNSDIDAVLVTPSFIHRDDFFSSFLQVLGSHSTIKDILPIPGIFVPLIKMKVEGTSVDLIMSRLNLPYVPCPLMFYEKPEIFYCNIDQYSVHGLSGLHLVQKFRELVPEFSLFTDLLKVIKTWASRRFIKDYVYGFPASVAWAVLCAYICINTGLKTSLSNSYMGLLDQTVLMAELADFQATNLLMRPINENGQIISRPTKRKADATLTTLVQIFFTYFSHWLWPCPVILSPVVSIPKLKLYSWESRPEFVDNPDVMPIITPVFPHKNAAYTVRTSTRDIVTKELKRAHDLVKKIISGVANWADLFEKYDIRQDHRHFLKLELTANGHQELFRLEGLIDSRLRDLASFLEENQFIRSVRICRVKCNSNGQMASCSSWLLGMDIKKAPVNPDGSQPECEVDITEHLVKFYNLLHERDPRTNFLEKLIASYATLSEVKSLRL